MAKIEKRENKKGIVYRIRVFDKRLRGGETSKTYKPEKGMTTRQAKKEAEKQAFLFEEAVKQLLDEQEQGIKPRKKFIDVADEWLMRVERKHTMKISTLERNKQCKERTYKAIGDIWIDELKKKDIQTFIDSLECDGVNKKTGKGLSPKTQKHYITFISDVLNFAVSEEYVEKNICRNIEISKPSETEKPKDKKVYSLDEVESIYLKLMEQSPINYKVLFSIFAFYGLRRGEVLGLEYKDIDFESGRVEIKRTSNYRNKNTGIYTSTPKNKTSIRTVYFSADVLTMIKELFIEQQEQKHKCGDLWVDNDRLFIQWNGEPLHPNTAYTYLERFCEREGLPFKGLHSFRHSFITQAISNGEPINVVSGMAGHSKPTTTLSIYTHEFEQATAKAMFTVENAIKNHKKRQK